MDLEQDSAFVDHEILIHAVAARLKVASRTTDIGDEHIMIKHLPVAAVALAAAVGLVGCGASTVRQAAPVAISTTTTSAVAEFPKVIPVAPIGDARIRLWAKLTNPSVTTVVEVAPGVYASRGPGPLGTVSDYKSVFGLCANVTPFEVAHHTGGSCW